ncbi:MAG: hypothetical protein FWH26_03485 [Oscillospiraceae bacterium]|nr:hypothetical protein [Oscillospiraceae bacterium]
MLDQKTLAYINMYAILGTLENLCELDPEARALMTNPKPIALAFDVKGGPKATITFAGGRVRVRPGIHKCDIKIPVGSCEKFNAVINGTATPVPVKGFRYISFLLKDFDALTKLLERYLRASEEDLADPVFFERSTTLMLYVIAVSLSQIGDYDEIGRFSAGYIPDGEVAFSIKNGPAATIHAKDHVLSTEKRYPENPRAIMEFESLELARALFDGKVNALACIGNGSIAMSGMINMIDNLNRILDRVALYLA